MSNDVDIIKSIKNKIRSIDPKAKVILYGSFARGDNKDLSDIDLLILLEKDEISIQDKIKISYPLYDIEFETGQIINPLVLSRSDWESRHRITPFYENVINEGVIL
jgi:predicted nucleotidyltransferase